VDKGEGGSDRSSEANAARFDDDEELHVLGGTAVVDVNGLSTETRVL
jgi:hypothetical protein